MVRVEVVAGFAALGRPGIEVVFRLTCLLIPYSLIVFNENVLKYSECTA